MSDDWFQKQNELEAETAARAYRDRCQRWEHRIHSTPAIDLAVIKASLVSMKRLAFELLTQNLVPNWEEVGYLAMDYLTNAIHAGACGGTEWLEWRMRLGGNPSITSAVMSLSKCAPPQYGYGPPKANGLYAQRAAEINTLILVIEQIVGDIEKRQLAQPSAPPPIPTEQATEDHLEEILQALLELQAFDPQSRKAAPLVARKALGPGVDPAVVKRAMSALQKRGDIGTKRGRTGGAWLTAKGRTTAERINGNK